MPIWVLMACHSGLRVRDLVATFKWAHFPATTIPVEALTFAGCLRLTCIWVEPFYAAPFARLFAGHIHRALTAIAAAGEDLPSSRLLE